MPTSPSQLPPTCRLLDEDPELATAVPAERRQLAEAECIAPVLALPRGPWRGQERLEADGFGLLVLSGVLIRRVGIDGRYGAELLGEGDLLRPWQGDGPHSSVLRVTDWRLLTAVRMAVLDGRVMRRMARHPELAAALVERALRRSRKLAANMAIVQHARVDVRLEMMLWLLADRWGTVGPDGVRLRLPLTQEVLAELIAARRPTVSTALAQLARGGRITATAQGWLLHGEPPGELAELHPVGLTGARSEPSRQPPAPQP